MVLCTKLVILQEHKIYRVLTVLQPQRQRYLSGQSTLAVGFIILSDGGKTEIMYQLLAWGTER